MCVSLPLQTLFFVDVVIVDVVDVPCMFFVDVVIVDEDVYVVELM